MAAPPLPAGSQPYMCLLAATSASRCNTSLEYGGSVELPSRRDEEIIGLVRYMRFRMLVQFGGPNWFCYLTR